MDINSYRDWLKEALELQKLMGQSPTAPNLSSDDLSEWWDQLGGVVDSLGQLTSQPSNLSEIVQKAVKMWNVKKPQKADSSEPKTSPPVHQETQSQSQRIQLDEGSQQIIVSAFLPGIRSKEDLNVMVQGQSLSIAGRGYLQQAGYMNAPVPYNESVRLPAEVDPTKVTASYQQGYLTIMLPKRKSPQSQVNVSFKQ